MTGLGYKTTYQALAISQSTVQFIIFVCKEQTTIANQHRHMVHLNYQRALIRGESESLSSSKSHKNASKCVVAWQNVKKIKGQEYFCNTLQKYSPEIKFPATLRIALRAMTTENISLDLNRSKKKRSEMYLSTKQLKNI